MCAQTNVCGRVRVCVSPVFNSLMPSKNPCKESDLIQVHRVISEVHGTFIIMFPLVAFPSSCRQVDIPLLLSWLQHWRHHEVISNQELGVDLIGSLIIIGNPPEGPYDWVSCIKNHVCQFKNFWCHQSFMEPCELLCYLYHLQMHKDIELAWSRCHLTDSRVIKPSARPASIYASKHIEKELTYCF